VQAAVTLSVPRAAAQGNNGRGRLASADDAALLAIWALRCARQALLASLVGRPADADASAAARLQVWWRLALDWAAVVATRLPAPVTTEGMYSMRGRRRELTGGAVWEDVGSLLQPLTHELHGGFKAVGANLCTTQSHATRNSSPMSGSEP
jgi:hypothetical protein